MNPYLNVLMSVIILYFVSLIYNQFKLHEKWNDQVQHYDLVKQFLIDDNINAINTNHNAKKPIITTDIQLPAKGLMLLSSAAFLPKRLM